MSEKKNNNWNPDLGDYKDSSSSEEAPDNDKLKRIISNIVLPILAGIVALLILIGFDKISGAV